MKIYEVGVRTPYLVVNLLKVWEDSVRATHLFLLDSEVKQIKKYVPQALNGVEHLICAVNEPGSGHACKKPGQLPLKQRNLKSASTIAVIENVSGKVVAFMGIEKGRLEMLFISPEEIAKGLGKKLIQYGIQNYEIQEVTVNEKIS